MRKTVERLGASLRKIIVAEAWPTSFVSGQTYSANTTMANKEIGIYGPDRSW